MAEELHPIELDDGNIAPEVRQVVEEQQGAAQQDIQAAPVNIPSPEEVFDRFIEFERNLRVSWDEFTGTLIGEVNELREEISSIEESVEELKRMEKRQVDFAIGDSVVLNDVRKVGKVTHVTAKQVEVLLDGEQNTRNTVTKKKTNVMRLYR